MKKILLVISAVTLLFSTTMIIRSVYQSRQNKMFYDDLVKIYYGNEEEDIIDKKVTDEDDSINEKKFKELRSINKDIIGWIQVPDTEIDYPVVQGEDNDYYLEHNIYGNQSKYGSIFMDYRNNLQKDSHIVIYGHNMKDGSMFRDLVKYKEEDFFSGNSEITMEIQGEVHRYQIFSVVVIPGDTEYIKVSFSSTEEFLDYVGDIKEASYRYRELNFSGGEKIITLATCSYEFSDARTVVHGVRIDESFDVDTMQIE